MKKLVIQSVLLICIAFMPVASLLAKAVPVKAAATLLSLYRESDTIAVGRFDKKEEFGTNRVGNGYTVVCADGSVSHSGGIQGACSHHGGVGP